MKKQSNIQTSVEPSGDAVNKWHLPDIEPTMPSQQTNAMGKPIDWQNEIVEEKEIDVPKPLTADDIECMRQAAYDEGFNQGKEEGFSQGYNEGKDAGYKDGVVTGEKEGFAKGFEDGENEINEKIEIFKKLIDGLQQPLKTIDNNIEQQLLVLVSQLTEAVTLHEAKTNPEILLSALGKGLAVLPCHEQQTQILLNPLDIKIIEEKFGEAHINEQGWKLMPSPQLAQGSCQIENSTSSIDLSIKSRLQQVLENYLQQAIHQKS